MTNEPSNDKNLSPGLLGALGRALYGDHWRLPLASALDVSERTVRRWGAGEFLIPAGIAEKLEFLMEAKFSQLEILAVELIKIIDANE